MWQVVCCVLSSGKNMILISIDINLVYMVENVDCSADASDYLDTSIFNSPSPWINSNTINQVLLSREDHYDKHELEKSYIKTIVRILYCSTVHCGVFRCKMWLCVAGVAGVARLWRIHPNHLLLARGSDHQDRQVPQRQLLVAGHPDVHSAAGRGEMRRFREQSQEQPGQDVARHQDFGRVHQLFTQSSSRRQRPKLPD